MEDCSPIFSASHALLHANRCYSVNAAICRMKQHECVSRRRPWSDVCSVITNSIADPLSADRSVLDQGLIPSRMS